jgi:hypothetical protein
MVDAMYKDVPGAHLQSDGGRLQYVLPCDVPVNVTFTFGGKAYVMHPLDMSIDTGHGGGMCSATVSILECCDEDLLLTTMMPSSR